MDRLKPEARFRNWTRANRELLLASGIPIVAWESARNWSYLLGHGCLTYEIDPSGFEVGQLNAEQLKALLRLVESDDENGPGASIRSQILTLIDP